MLFHYSVSSVEAPIGPSKYRSHLQLHPKPYCTDTIHKARKVNYHLQKRNHKVTFCNITGQLRSWDYTAGTSKSQPSLQHLSSLVTTVTDLGMTGIMQSRQYRKLVCRIHRLDVTASCHLYFANLPGTPVKGRASTKIFFL